MEVINLGVGDGLPPVSWGAVVEKLDDGSAPDPDAHNARTKWLTTVNEDGSPHVTAVGAIWLDGEPGAAAAGRIARSTTYPSPALSMRAASRYGSRTFSARRPFAEPLSKPVC